MSIHKGRNRKGKTNKRQTDRPKDRPGGQLNPPSQTQMQQRKPLIKWKVSWEVVEAVVLVGEFVEVDTTVEMDHEVVVVVVAEEEEDLGHHEKKEKKQKVVAASAKEKVGEKGEEGTKTSGGGRSVGSPIPPGRGTSLSVLPSVPSKHTAVRVWK